MQMLGKQVIASLLENFVLHPAFNYFYLDIPTGSVKLFEQSA